MGNRFGRSEADPDSAWKEQNKEMAANPMYKYVNFVGGGKLIEAYKSGGEPAVEKMAKTEILPFLYNNGNGAMLSKVDIIKWQCKKQAKYTGSTVWETRTDEELLSDFKEDYFNKVTPHEACWDLDKRGGVGETPFHLLYLLDSPEHHAVGEVLLRLYPKMALDVYEGEEYYGEGALHLAVVFGSMDAVKLLIAKGANINQRATGRFFLPEDQKKGVTRETNYEGYAYYGEYPLAFAAATGKQDIYDYLIENGADPNLQDSFGNTALHMVVISNQVEMYKYIVRHHKRPAKTDIKNKENLTPLTLASKLGRHTIFKEMLELGSLELWRYSNITCSLYPLLALDSIGPKGDTNWNSALMIIINGENDDHLEMLEGGVMRQLLEEKWKTFARKRFFVRLVIAFIHLALISAAVYTRPGKNLLAVNSYVDVIRFVCEILTCIFCAIIVVLNVKEVISQGIYSYLKNSRNAPAQTLFNISCVLILLCIPFRFLELKQVEDVLLIIAVPCAWMLLLFFARSVKLTGPFVTMIYKMLVGDLLRFGIIYLIFLTGFTQAFYFLFQGNTNKQSQGFDNIGDTILTLFQMTLGEFKYQDFNYTKYAWLTKTVFAIFMMLVPILLLNMLIAMMGNTYQMVIAKSEKEWRRQWAKIVVVLERGFSKEQLMQFQQTYAIKLMGPPKDNLAEITDPVDEQRALMVIKSSNKTKARQRKGAVNNWKRSVKTVLETTEPQRMVGKEVIKQIKKHRLRGKSGPLQLQKIARRRQHSIHPESEFSDDEDEKAKLFSLTLAQLAWERDIDLTKGKTFVTDPNLIEKIAPFDGTKSNKEEEKTVTQAPQQNHQIPNGIKHRSGERTVKKPAGTPKSSPKSATTKQFSYNRVSPLALTKQPSATDESSSDLEGSKPISNDRAVSGMSTGEISLHGADSVRFSQNVRPFLDDSQPPPEFKKLPWDVPNVDFRPTVSSVKSGSVRSDVTSSDYKPSAYSKSEDGYTSQGSIDSSSKASKELESVKSESSKRSTKSKTSASVISESSKYSSKLSSGQETVGSESLAYSSKPRDQDSVKSEIEDSKASEETESVSHVSKSSRHTKASRDSDLLQYDLEKPASESKEQDKNQDMPQSPKKKHRKSKKSKKSRHSSHTSSTASLLRLSEAEGKEQDESEL